MPKEASIDMRSFKAGQLSNFVDHWREMQAPEFLIRIIQGYRIPFQQKPPLVMPRLSNKAFHTPVSLEMTSIVIKMLNQGILEIADQTPSFVSTLFLVAKSDGSARPIFNLKALNKFVLTEPFRLINVFRVPDFIQPLDWMCKLDISQAYFHLKVAESHRRFLRLIYKEQLLQMTCLPFGLNTSPKTFASLTNWIAQVMRGKGVRILVFLDDFLIAHQDPDILSSHVSLLVKTLQYLGWQINFQKSVLIPKKSLVYLGIHWNPWLNLKSLPMEKIPSMLGKIFEILNSGKVDVKKLQSIIGALNFASFVVQRGRLHYRTLLRFLNSLDLDNTVGVHIVPVDAKNDLRWWAQNLQHPSILHHPPASHFVTTDASDLGWGAQLDNQSLWGPWSEIEKNFHCNVKEMLAILKVLQSHAQYLRQSTVTIQCDNRTVVAYLRHEGGTKSSRLMDITYDIFCLVDQYHIHVNVYYIPGRYNSHADHLSRFRQAPEWHLLPECTKIIFVKWGIPQVDLFASSNAHVVPHYVSKDQNDRQAIAHDAFSIAWNFNLAWVFPPPFLIPRVLSYLNQASGMYLVIAPRWEKVFWRGDLKSRALAPPFTIQNLSQALVDVTTGVPPPRVQDLVLEVWKCGGGHKI